jgi:hypothetical protein
MKLQTFLFQMVVTSCISVQYLWKYCFAKSSDNLYSPCILLTFTWVESHWYIIFYYVCSCVPSSIWYGMFRSGMDLVPVTCDRVSRVGGCCIQNYSYDFCFINILNLASDPDRLTRPGGVAEQGAEEGISICEDECCGRKEKILLWGASQFLLFYHILLGRWNVRATDGQSM